jgi:pimeloyl-ACP methyl ester carboxylesterase
MQSRALCWCVLGLGGALLCDAGLHGMARAADPPAQPARAAPAYGAELEGFDYPYPSAHFDFESQQQKLHMAYLDVPARGKSNGHTVVLLHGKNFCAGTWGATIQVLSRAGYRSIAPDQIGFCKSSKPAGYQYSFQQLAANTRELLAQLGVQKFVLIGHSMGGMLATRYALTFPADVEHLVLVNPLGLEDWKAKGVPYHSVDQWFQDELQTDAERIRRYQQNTYYAGTWKPEYDVWVEMLAGMYRGAGRRTVAWSSALTYDMIYTQPVLYEVDLLHLPVSLLIGKKDNTVIGKAFAPAAVQKTLGHYSELGPALAARIPHAHLVTFDNLGHAPQIQDPARFHQALLAELAR